jgi:hypothetical protein
MAQKMLILALDLVHNGGWKQKSHQGKAKRKQLMKIEHAMKQINALGSVLIVLICAGMAIHSQAATVTEDATVVFNGIDYGTTPSAMAIFTDLSPGEVQLTLSVAGLSTVSDANVNTWWLNVTSAYFGNLTFTYKSQVGSFQDPSIHAASSIYGTEADDAGYYDYYINNFGAGSQAFTNGESITYDITSSVTGLDAADFVQLASTSHGTYTSAPPNTDGDYYDAVELNDGQYSPYFLGDAADPLPAPAPAPDGGSTSAFLGLALIGMGGMAKKIRQVWIRKI